MVRFKKDAKDAKTKNFASASITPQAKSKFSVSHLTLFIQKNIVK